MASDAEKLFELIRWYSQDRTPKHGESCDWVLNSQEHIRKDTLECLEELKRRRAEPVDRVNVLGDPEQRAREVGDGD